MEVNHACDLALVMEEEDTPPEEGATSEVKAPTVSVEESVETSMKKNKETGKTDKKNPMDPDVTAEDVTHTGIGSTSVL